MLSRAAPIRCSRRERLQAAYVTGPLGHFVAGALDIGGLLGRYALLRARAALRARLGGFG